MKDILELISNYFDGDLNSTDMMRLSEWINSSRGNADTFARYARLHSSLGDALKAEAAREQFHHASQIETAAETILPRRAGRLFDFKYLTSIGLAACLLIAATMPFQTRKTKSRADTCARLEASLNAQWKTAPQDAALQPGEYAITKGSVKLSFLCGSQVIVAGPATFQISSNRLKLLRGQIAVTCPTSASRRFISETDGATIIDLGTEYGVANLPEGASEIEVFQGSIQLKTSPDEPAQSRDAILTVGDARRVDSHLQIAEQLSFGKRYFLRDDEFELRSHAENSPNDAWPSHALAMLEDRTLQFWTNMSPAWDGRSTANLAQTSSPWLSTVGNFSPIRFGHGQAGTGSAATFIKANDAIRTTIPDDFHEITLAAWVHLNPDESVADRHRGILMSDSWGKAGQIHWQVKGRGIRLSVFARGDDEDPRFSAETDNLVDGQWHFLVSQITRQGVPSVQHYVDGALVYRRAVPSLPTALTIGPCTLGGWSHDETKISDDRTLNGSLGDVFVWSRALSPAEVQQLYQQMLHQGSR